MFFTNWFKKKPIKRNRFQDTIDILEGLKNPNDHRYLYSSDYKIIDIVPLYSNIVKYNKALEHIVHSFKNNTYMDKQYISSDKYFTNIHSFLLDDKLRYVDINKEIPIFINSSIELLSIFNDKEFESEQSPELSRNLYLSQFVVSNLISITEGFKDVES